MPVLALDGRRALGPAPLNTKHPLPIRCMQRSRQLSSIASLLVLVMGVASCSAIAADQDEPTSLRSVVYQAPVNGIGVEGKEVTITHFGISPGFVGERHMHPGPFFVYVLAGELTVESEGEVEIIRTGEIFTREAGTPVLGRNASGSDDLKILVFEIGDLGQATMIEVN